MQFYGLMKCWTRRVREHRKINVKLSPYSAERPARNRKRLNDHRTTRTSKPGCACIWWHPTDKLSSLLMHTATTERNSSSPPTKNFERFSSLRFTRESFASHAVCFGRIRVIADEVDRTAPITISSNGAIRPNEFKILNALLANVFGV